MTTINLSLDFDIDLKVSEVWPDGEPDDWGAQDVAALFGDGTTAQRTLRDWSLLDGCVMRVNVERRNPLFMQHESLIPDLAPKPTIRTTAEVRL